MNFLAHVYLSGRSEQVMVGNFIGDWVKGRNYTVYPADIQKGILMHRAIDSFTDNHEIVKKTKAIFYESHKRYSGIIADVVYDHFLSVHWNKYSNTTLPIYISNIHNVLERYKYIFPSRFSRILPSLVYHKWLSCYSSYYGLEKVFTRMSERTSLPNSTEIAIQLLRVHYEEVDFYFESFFAELQDYIVREFYIELY